MSGKIVFCVNAFAAMRYEKQQLTQLRNWLLPMLMNGQVMVA